MAAMQAHERDGVTWVAAGDVLVGIWDSGATESRWQWHLEGIERLASQYPDGILYLDLVLSNSHAPSAALRAQQREDVKRLGSKLRRVVLVPMGDGLWFSLVRAIVRAALLVNGTSSVLSVASNLEAGIAQVRELGGAHTPSTATLQEAVAAAFASLGLEAPKRAA